MIGLLLRVVSPARRWAWQKKHAMRCAARVWSLARGPDDLKKVGWPQMPKRRHLECAEAMGKIWPPTWLPLDIGRLHGNSV